MLIVHVGVWWMVMRLFALRAGVVVLVMRLRVVPVGDDGGGGFTVVRSARCAEWLIMRLFALRDDVGVLVYWCTRFEVKKQVGGSACCM